jgi:dTDP-4-dehydrorhamnose 3,5-epimerase
VTLKLIETTLANVKILEPVAFEDKRGYFQETWNEALLASLGIHERFVQDCHSRSEKGVLRGLHYQILQTQGKLLRVGHGCVIDVVVDLRRSSSTFGKHLRTELSAENRRMLWVPPGFAHGFYVLSNYADFLYKATDYYAPSLERTLHWNDPSLGIDWGVPVDQAPTLSAKDQNGELFSECEYLD